jgi:hypothetical protein
MLEKEKKPAPAIPCSPCPAGRAVLSLRLLAALGALAVLAEACTSAADKQAQEATHSAGTIARMITEVAFQNTSQPSSTPTAYAPPEVAATATTGPTLTPTEIATVELSSPTPNIGRATYSGSTPTTDPALLRTQTLTHHDNAAFFLGAKGNIAIPAGSAFTLTLIIRNVGTNTWYPSYLIFWYNGARMECPAYIFLPEVTAPNQTLFLAMNLMAPDVPNTYYQRWYFRDPYDTRFGVGPNADEPLMVYIEVV